MITFDDLVNFLNDLVDHHRLVAGDCGSIAKDLQHKAKSAGIRAGIAMIQLTYPHSTCSLGPEHYFNVFDTMDQGRIFVDASYYGRVYIIQKEAGTYLFLELYDRRVIPVFPNGALTEPILLQREKNIAISW